MTKLTRKDIEYYNKPILRLGQEHSILLSDNFKIGYNQGLYGWNWTAYNYPDYIIITAYRNTPKNTIIILHEDSKKYNSKFVTNSKMKYQSYERQELDRQKQLDDLVNETLQKQ